MIQEKVNPFELVRIGLFTFRSTDIKWIKWHSESAATEKAVTVCCLTIMIVLNLKHLKIPLIGVI
jgi:hypothetical protein